MVAHRPADQSEQSVAGVVAVGVVDLLQVIDIDEGDRQCPACSPGALDLVRDLREAEPASPRTGQLVGCRDFECMLGFAPGAAGLGAITRGGFAVGRGAGPISRSPGTLSRRLFAKLGARRVGVLSVPGREKVSFVGLSIALRAGSVSLLCCLEPGRRGLVPQQRHLVTDGGFVLSRQPRLLVNVGITARCEVSIRSDLVCNGAVALAIAGRLILIGPGLILIAHRLVAIGQRLLIGRYTTRAAAGRTCR